MIHVNAEKAVTEELTHDELWSLTAGQWQHGKYDCILLNFDKSGKPFRKIRVPRAFNSTMFYYGIRHAIPRLGYTGKIKMNGHKDHEGVETVLLRRLSAVGNKCNLAKRRRELENIEKLERFCNKELTALKVIDELSITSKLNAAYVRDIKQEMKKYHNSQYPLRNLVIKGLVVKPLRSLYVLTEEGRKQLAESTKKL